ncbi:MAG: hypothetical protein ACRDKW_11400 [Actinomycetota bacterium]
MPTTPSHRRFGAALAGGALLLSVAIGSAFAVTGPEPAPAAPVDDGGAGVAATMTVAQAAPAPVVLSPGPVPEASAATPTAPAEEAPPAAPAPTLRTVVETNDNEATVFVDADGGLSASLSATDELRDEADDVRLYAYGDVSAGVLTVEVELANGTGGTIAFPGGVRAQVTITRDGAPWRTLELSDPSVTGLAPGSSLTLHATVPGADGPAGYGFGVSIETLQS